MASSIVGTGQGLTNDYDLITLDLEMPDLSGQDVAELFQDQTPDTPLLVISGYMSDSVTKKLETVGVRHTLSKPFKKDELLDAVGAAISGEVQQTAG